MCSQRTGEWFAACSAHLNQVARLRVAQDTLDCAGEHPRVAARDGFPDQYQLDHILEVEASANGHDQGYSGWVELEDGSLFVVHYTDDTAAACTPNPHHLGVPWIRGTIVRPEDWPPAARRRSRGPSRSGRSG